MEEEIKFLNRQLELVLLPTEKCNNRCLYCNQHFEKGRMGPEVIDGIKNLVNARAPEIENLTIQWFGGEPPLAYDIVIDIMRHVSILKELNNFSLSSTMTTNARLLSPNRLETLVNLGVAEYQVSFDGNKEEHDKLRLSADGGGTFDKIWENLLGAHRSNLEFGMILRMHINANNEDSMSLLLDKIAAEIGNDKRFSVFIRFLERFGGPNDAKLPISEDLETLARLTEKARLLGLSLYGIDLYKEGNEPICYAAKPFAFVVRSDGTLNKCTVSLYSDHNHIGRINRDGTMEINQQKARLWSRGFFSGKSEELSCPIKNFPVEECTPILRKGNDGMTRLRVVQ